MSIQELYDPAVSVKVVEVAKKYEEPKGQPMMRTPEYTPPGGPNSYHCSNNDKAWTQGFFPGILWLLVERLRSNPEMIDSSYKEEEIVRLARRYQEGFEYLKRPSINHDQGFRFQLSYGRDFDLFGGEHAKQVMIDAADSLVDRYNPTVGCIRSWDAISSTRYGDKYSRENRDKHYLTIIDNMMNLDMMYEVTKLTGDQKYAKIANHQAEKSMTTHVRPDYTTYHVVNFDQKTGEAIEKFTHQGYADESCWSRGQAWAMYGYAQCALRTGRQDFRDTCQKLTDVFLSLLPESGVPWWDFQAPKPCAYDSSAATVAARGMQMLYQLLLPTKPEEAKKYLARAEKLIIDTLRECATPKASLKGGKVDFGEGGWETLLMHATINGNEYSVKKLVDHGLVYADYYLIEYANEALKMKKGN